MNGKRAKLIRKALGLSFKYTDFPPFKPQCIKTEPFAAWNNPLLNQYRRAKRAYTANKGAF